MASRVITFAVLAMVAASCSSAVPESADPAAEIATTAVEPVPEDDVPEDEVPEDEVIGFGPAPEVPEGDFTPEIAVAIDTVFGRGTLAETRTNEQNQALVELGRGNTIEEQGIRIIKSGSGIRAEDTDGNDLVAHQAFWFAWSQFHEYTEIWPEL